MIIVKSPAEIEKMSKACQLSAAVLKYAGEQLNAGMSTYELDKLIYDYIIAHGAKPSFLGYGGFKGSACISLNDEVIHGIPDKKKIIRSGDIVSIDVGAYIDGYHGDNAYTFKVGAVSPVAEKLLRVTNECLHLGIAAAKPGNRMCDVDNACRDYITEMGYGPYFTHRTGHSIGMEDHEFGDVSSVNTDIIKPGQCFSVEPGIYLMDEGIGVRIEDIVLITEDGCEVLNNFTKDLIVVPMED